jgi:hypothetical protein
MLLKFNAISLNTLESVHFGLNVKIIAILSFLLPISVSPLLLAVCIT